jgi:YgiT-type zinc finger domain-containing protein
VLDADDAIETYSDDTPYPSALYLGFVSGRPLHVVAADDDAEQQTIVVTVYEPDPSYIQSEESLMKCVICKTGETKATTATFTVNHDGHTYVLREVPAQVCQQCGEPYFDADVTKQVLAQVERASQSGADVAVLKFQAA